MVKHMIGTNPIYTIADTLEEIRAELQDIKEGLWKLVPEEDDRD